MRILTFLAALFWALPSLAQPVTDFVVSVGAEDPEEDEIDGVALAPDGTVSMTGVARGGITLGGINHPSRGQGDVFLASYDATGAMLWGQVFGGPGDDNAYDMGVDALGNLYLSGWFAGTVNFGGVSLTSAGGQDMFVAKVSPAGEVLWARRFGGPADDGGNEIAVTQDGSVAVSAISGGAFTAGLTYPHRGTRDAYVLRIDTGGSLLWVTPFAGPGNERIRAMGMAETGEVFAGFTYRNSLSANGATIPALGDWDGAIARLSPAGAVAWVRHVGSSAGEDNVRGLDVGPDGSVYASGRITGSGSFFGGPVPAELAPGGDYMVSLDESGMIEATVIVAGQGLMGTELESYDGGFIMSGTVVGPLTARLNGMLLGTTTVPPGRRTSYLLGLTDAGALDLLTTSDPASGGVARGGPIDLSADGSDLVHVVRWSGSVNVAGTALLGTSTAESALVSLHR